MRWIVRLIGLVVVLAGFALGALFLLPADRLGRIASDQLTGILGRDVTLDEVRLGLFPSVSLNVTGFRIANPEWAGAEPFLAAKSATIRVDAMAALGGEVLISAIDVAEPVVTLQTRADGSANWDFGGGPAEASAPAASEGGDTSSVDNATLQRVTMTGGDITLAFAGAAKERLRDVDLDLAWPDRAGPLDLKAALTREGLRLELAAAVDNPDAMMAGKPSRLDATLSTAAGTVRFDGTAGLAPELQGALKVDLGDAPALARALGVALPPTLGKTVAFTGDTTLTQDGTLSVRNGTLSAAGHALSLAADVTPGDVPRINAQVSTAALDLSRFLQSGEEGGQTAGGGGENGWSRDRIDASALGLFNGEIAFSAGSVNLGDLHLGSTRTLMSLDRSRAVFTLKEVQAYEGVATGQFVANNRSGLSVGGTIAIKDVAMEPLLTDAAGLTRFSGKGNLTLSFLGSGQSVQAIMSSLKGDGTVSAGPGVISGIDLDKIMRGDTSGGGTTVFNTLTASYVIENGILRNSDLAMDLPLLAASGEGKIDLGQRSLDYLLTVHSAEARGGKGLSVPVRIKGPWSSPAIRPDLDELLNQNFEEEKKQLEDKVRTEVTKKVEKELGVTVEEGQTVEDALKQKLEDEAKKGLLKLLKP